MSRGQVSKPNAKFVWQMHVVCNRCWATTFEGVRECFLLFADSAAHELQHRRGSVFNQRLELQILRKSLEARVGIGQRLPIRVLE